MADLSSAKDKSSALDEEINEGFSLRSSGESILKIRETNFVNKKLDLYLPQISMLRSTAQCKKRKHRRGRVNGAEKEDEGVAGGAVDKKYPRNIYQQPIYHRIVGKSLHYRMSWMSLRS